MQNARAARCLEVLCLAALVAGAAVCYAAGQNEARVVQSDGRISDGRIYVDSQITLGTGYPPIANKSFVNTPVMPLNKGTLLPSRGVIGRLGMDRMLSLRRHDFVIRSRTVAYPVVGLMRCSNFSETGSFVKVIASTTVMKANAGGQPAHSGGFVIDTAQPIQAGESIPSVRVVFQDKNFIFAIAEAPSAMTKNPDAAKAQPAVSISPEHVTAADRAIALEAWRLSNQSVREGILK